MRLVAIFTKNTEGIIIYFKVMYEHVHDKWKQTRMAFLFYRIIYTFDLNKVLQM